MGANFENHELGSQPLVARNQADFYARSTDFDESTEIDRNQQFLTYENELDGYNFISITNRNDWSMNPNRVDLDLSTVNTMASPHKPLLSSKIKLNGPKNSESNQNKIQKSIGFSEPFTPIVKLMEMPQDLSE